MECSFPVTLAGKIIGKVTVRRQGLYYLFNCRCSLAGDVLYRLVVTCGSVRENLGILVPENSGFVIKTKIPVKRIGEGNMFFSLVSRQEQQKQVFVPISPEEPFAYISRLKRSFLAHQDGQTGIIL